MVRVCDFVKARACAKPRLTCNRSQPFIVATSRRVDVPVYSMKCPVWIQLTIFPSRPLNDHAWTHSRQLEAIGMNSRKLHPALRLSARVMESQNQTRP